MKTLHVTLASLIWTCASFAQDPNHILTVDSASIDNNGDTTTVDVRLENLSAIDAWSFGICYDLAVVHAQGVAPGSAVPMSADFRVEFIGPGYVQQHCVLSYVGAVVIPAGTQDAHLLTIDLVALGQPGDSTALSFCSPGSPPSANVLSAGTTEVNPTLVDGTVSVGSTTPFKRGDCNNNGSFNLADIVLLLAYLFPSSGTPSVLECEDACDTNDTGTLNLSDVVTGLNALFGQPTVPLVEPYTSCGPDNIADTLGCTTAAGCP